MARQHPFGHRIVKSERLSVSTTSVQSGSCPFGASIAQIRSHGTSGSPLNYVQVGLNPVAVTDGSSSFIHNGDAEHFLVRPDSSPGAGDGEKIAAVSSAGSAYVFIDWLEA